MLKKLKILKKLIKFNNINGYIIPKNDAYFSEFSFSNHLKKISNFSGSAGFAIILEKENLLFVDGRYTAQAKIECGNSFNIFEIPKIWPKDILKKHKKNFVIGFDPQIFTNLSLNRYFSKNTKLRPIKKNLIEQVVKTSKKKYIQSFYNLNNKIAGESINSKINRLIKILKKKNLDNIFISAPENVAWLLNLRGGDNPNSPIPNCKIILSKNKKIYFFSCPKKINKIKKILPYKKFKFCVYKDFLSIINNLVGKNFCIDGSTCSVCNENLIKSKFKIKNFLDPCYAMKSIKNTTEINNMKQAHIYDGAAVTKFIYWIKNNKKFNLTELDVEKKLENFRKKNKNYLYPSFNTIAGSGPNSAIIHYRATKSTNRKIKSKDLLLCDSGGQYKYGTTDITRTICFKKPSSKIKNIFTRVLKGHIAVANTDINKSKTGSLIDKKARYWLKKINLDYSHGTGHGVGYFLNVHEGPQAISKFNNYPLQKGMVLSNEPGYYKKNEFGIRIENLIFVNKQKNNLFFKNLTLAPIDIDLINFNLLDLKEKEYMFKYHLETYAGISKYLNKKERNWFLNLI